MVLTANVIRGLTGGIDANAITFGTLSNARLPSVISGNGNGLMSLSASNISTGILSNERLPTTIQANFVGNAQGVSGLNIANVSIGILPVVRGGTGAATSTGTGNVVLSDAPTMQGVTVSGLTVCEMVSTSTQGQLHVRAPSGGLGRSSSIRMYSTFGGAGGDTGTRYTSSIRSGFSTFGWTDPYTSIYVNRSGTANDAQLDSNQNEVMTLYGNGTVVIPSNIVSVSNGTAVVTAMNTTTAPTGSMPGYIHALGCSLHSGSAAGVSTGIVTPTLGAYNAADAFTFYKGSPALYDFWRTYINLAAGTYTFRLHAAKQTDRAIVTLVVGSTTVGTIDMYSAAGGFDSISDLIGIVIPSTTVHKIELQINSKNNSATNYNFNWRCAAFIRTS